MPRTRFEDDDRDEPRSRVRNNSGPVVLILAVVAGFLLLLVVGGGLTAFLMVNRARQAESLARAEAREAAEAVRDPSKAAGAKRLMSRKEFEAAVRGKAKDEIIAAVGPPDVTHEGVKVGGGPRSIGVVVDYWEFHSRVMSEVTGKPYPVVQVRLIFGTTCDLIEYP